MTRDDDDDRSEAKRALTEALTRSRVATGVISEAREQLSLIRQNRESNHYRDKFRAILQGRA